VAVIIGLPGCRHLPRVPDVTQVGNVGPVAVVVELLIVRLHFLGKCLVRLGRVLGCREITIMRPVDRVPIVDPAIEPVRDEGIEGPGFFR
jgi:hypothetical protein